LKKKLLTGSLILGFIIISASAAFARPAGLYEDFAPGRYKGQAGSSNTAHLYLYEKDPGTWEIVDGGAWGKMKHNLTGLTFSFVFNGHQLQPETEYSLIYYVDPGPGTWTVLPEIVVLASGASNGGGNLHLSGNRDTGSIPYGDDVNYPDGGKIWLVLTADIDTEASTFKWAWNPTEYLFEYDLLTFTYTE
jgi:hypothetical protein